MIKKIKDNIALANNLISSVDFPISLLPYAGVILSIASVKQSLEAFKQMEKAAQDDPRTDEEFFQDIKNEYLNMQRISEQINDNFYVFTEEFNQELNFRINYINEYIFKFEDQ
ncbi:hypothetical protein ACH5BF_02095 [Arcobacter sp. YIC-464]|uniref:hypothetical protein n=1 Tax=Arcobacter sp. YIC-464 TaxID=3376631 RepID=UPI003C1A0B44